MASSEEEVELLTAGLAEVEGVLVLWQETMSTISSIIVIRIIKFILCTNLTQPKYDWELISDFYMSVYDK